MRKLLVAAVAACAGLAWAKTSTPKGWTDDFEGALKQAKAEQKHVLVDFSGSDWCGWCKRLDSEVFAQPEFLAGATNKFVLVMIDSPSDKSLLSEKAKAQNPELVKKFGIRGFPTVLLLDADGNKVAQLGYAAGGPVPYLAKLEDFISPDVEKYIRPIETVLNEHDAAFLNEMKSIREKIKAKFPELTKTDLDEAARRKLTKRISRYGEKVMFEEIAAKYIPLYEKAFAEAKAMEVPEHMKAKKEALIGEQSARFEQLKKSAADYQVRKAARKARKDAKKAVNEKADDKDDPED